MSFGSPIELYHVVKKAWSQETVSTPFSADNPCKNQCAVTALAVQHYFGGEIVNTKTVGGTHFYNSIEDAYWDLAADQFDEPIPYENRQSSAEEALTHATQAQLECLIRNIENVR